MFTFIFLLFLLSGLGLRFWLAKRQIRHVLKHRDAVPSEFAERISLRSHQRAADYTIARVQLGNHERFADAIVLIALTLLGGIQALDLFFAAHIQHEILRQLLLVLSVFAIMGLVGLPFNIWKRFKLDAKFGFNRMTPALFIRDTLLSAVIGAVLASVIIAVALWVMASSPSGWPFYVWLCWIAFNLFILWMYPSVIAPLFNQFSPLDRPSLQERIETLATRCGFELNGLFVMDGSKRSSHANAYFTGLGKNKRIVFFDTLLKQLNDDEIEAVLAHELGHFKHRHIVKRMVLSFGSALGLLLILSWLSTKIWFYTDLGVVPQFVRPNDGLSLVLFFVCLPVFTFWLKPLASWFSRKDEFQADSYAAQQCPPSALRSALLKLYNDNAATLTPDPLHSAFYDSHPPALQRLQYLKTHEA